MKIRDECVKPAKFCPEGYETCSVLKGLDPESDSCRLWFANLPNDDVRDSQMVNYCFRYNTDDCRCINRSNTKEYKILKKGNSINDRCWFVPCANPERYFVTSDLQIGDCPSNVCEVVYDIYKDRDVSIYNNDMICDMSGSGAGVVLEYLKRYWPIILGALSLFGLVMSMRN